MKCCKIIVSSLHLVVYVVCGEGDAYHGVHLLGRVAEQALQVTDEPVDVSLAGRLEDDVFVVVVAEAARQLLVVHLGLVLADTPSAGNLSTKKLYFHVSLI